MATFYDTFNTDQAGGTTIGYAGTWGPDSTRFISISTGSANIANSKLNVSSGGALDVTLSYTFSSQQDFTNVTKINLWYLTYIVPNTISVSVRGDFAIVGSISTDAEGVVSVPVTFTVPIIQLAIRFTSTDPVSFTILDFDSTLVCVAHNSEIKTKTGTILVQNLRRGDEIEGGRVARLVKILLEKDAVVEVVKLEKDSLEDGLPNKDTIVCADHYLIYKGKRRLARSLIAFPGVKTCKAVASNLLPPDEEGNYYFYDVQFEEESFYVVNGLKSQSRSPYALVSPLAKELYFNKQLYREERVKNTLTQEPEITFLYLLPDGREVENFIKLVKC